jgi:hypothetical protein
MVRILLAVVLSVVSNFSVFMLIGAYVLLSFLSNQIPLNASPLPYFALILFLWVLIPFLLFRFLGKVQSGLKICGLILLSLLISFGVVVVKSVFF